VQQPEQLAGPMRGIGGAIQQQQQQQGTQSVQQPEQLAGPMRGIGGAIQQQQQQQGTQSAQQQTIPPEQRAGGPLRRIGGAIAQQPTRIEGTRQTAPAQLDPTACPAEATQESIECVCSYLDANDAEARSGGGPYSVQPGPAVAPVAPAAAKASAPQDNACVGGVQLGGDCRCSDGELAQRFTDRNVCIPVATPAGRSGATRSRTPAAASLPAACSGGQVGTPPNCHCPSGTQWSGRECRLVATQPPIQLCPPGLIAIEGQCVRLALPRSSPFDQRPAPGAGNTQSRTPVDSAARQACPADRPIGTYPNCCPRYTVSDGRGGCGGSDTAQKGGVSVAPPGSAKIPVPSSAGSTGVLTRGGGAAANALRCESWQVLRNGVCACPVGMTGPRCEEVVVR
jgi:hypothetical protein